MRPHPNPKAPDDSDGVSVVAAQPFWIVRMETLRTIQEYRCESEAQARRLAATLRAGVRQGRPPRAGR
jgi:hypothetical protein